MVIYCLQINCIQNEEGNILKVQQIRITKTEILRHRLMITDDSLKKHC